ncbi:hypothetical protein GCM10020219_078750 [Nonomuraea dietziae]
MRVGKSAQHDTAAQETKGASITLAVVLWLAERAPGEREDMAAGVGSRGRVRLRKNQVRGLTQVGSFGPWRLTSRSPGRQSDENYMGQILGGAFADVIERKKKKRLALTCRCDASKEKKNNEPTTELGLR